MTGRSFHELSFYLVDLERLFAAHQVRLLCGQLDQARQLLADYRSAFAAHFWEEERHLFPVYEPDPLRWPQDDTLERLRAAHHEISARLFLIQRELQFVPVNEDDRAERLLQIVEREAELKAQVAAYTRFKNDWFYVSLDRRIDPDQRATLLDRCTRRLGGSLANGSFGARNRRRSA